MTEQWLAASQPRKQSKLKSPSIGKIKADLKEASRHADARAALHKAEIEVFERLLEQERIRLRFISAIAFIALILALILLLLWAP